MQEIKSIKNAKVKYLTQLSKKSALRKKEKMFLIEGMKEIEKALNNEFEVDSIFFNPDIIDNKWINHIQDKYPDIKWVKVSSLVYKKIAYRDSTEGAIALTKMKNHKLEDLQVPENSLFLIAERIEKPGNIGAILRTSDGAGVDGFILVNPITDLYNPNVIRSSLGTIFSNKIAVVEDLEKLKNFLNKHDIHLYMATLQNANPYYKENYKKATAIAVGAEDKGLSEDFRKLKGKSVYIPMKGEADSLNVSVSAAILGYEAVRQRDTL